MYIFNVRLHGRSIVIEKKIIMLIKDTHCVGKLTDQGR